MLTQRCLGDLQHGALQLGGSAEAYVSDWVVCKSQTHRLHQWYPIRILAGDCLLHRAAVEPPYPIPPLDWCIIWVVDCPVNVPRRHAACGNVFAPRMPQGLLSQTSRYSTQHGREHQHED